ncbi:uncharacterized protein LOC131997323 [Stomoxys calcitrans]|uniref:uncharacterized protein LOC131997323 n=1 Tax=Stomoxys calcitrans TaxID=35570 RepID=UPI0027E2C60E|nr:uncharacterized protein LOC131997323 [Stomoxys calcitrans]
MDYPLRFFGVLTICYLHPKVEAKRDFKFEILDFKINVTDAELFSDSIYSSYDRQQLTVEFSMVQTITEWSGVFNVDILPVGGPITHILKLNGNICDCLRSACRNNLMVALFKEVFRSSNFPQKCPLLAKNKYYLRNYTVRADDYPAFLPQVMWQVNIDMMFNKKMAMTWFLKGRTGKF